MRLAVVSSHPIQYLAPIFRTLAQRIEIDVYFCHRASAQDQASAGFGVAFDWDVDLLSGYRHVFLDNVSKSPGTSRFGGCDTPGLVSLFEQERYDAVLVFGWYLKSYWQAIRACRRLGVPVLVRGDSQLNTPRPAAMGWAKHLIYPFLLRAFQAALYVGQRSRDYFMSYGYPSNRLFFSPHGVDAPWFSSRATPEARRGLRSRLGIADGEILLLFAGKLVEFKRPLDLIGAAARLRRSGKPVSVLVAGSGPLTGAMRSEAERCQVPLHLLGFQNQSEMPASYAASDMLVLPSNGRETWGLVANEALACGTPIVVSDKVGCAPDLAADRSVGRVFPLGDTQMLASAIGEILGAPPTLEAMAAKTRAYSIDVAAEGIVEAMRKVSVDPVRW